ncbi:MAG: ATPase, T2SS/T4P/T4SS family [Planctomycetota bacterium]|nr:ATPase, T2SS/T4P/T4SS family [Planctomycetota bacterium]MDG2085388.1 ATPase, T2SS/T4P/T4SS family [Planctomycetota bacterium]
MSQAIARFNRRLGKILARHRLVEDQAIDEAIQRSGEGGSVMRILIEEGQVAEDEFLGILAMETGVAPIDLGRLSMDENPYEELKEKIARSCKVLPVAHAAGVLTVAIADPHDILLLDEIRNMTRCQVQPVLACDFRIEEAIDRLYGDGRKEIEEVLEDYGHLDLELREGHDEVDEAIQELSFEGDESPVVKIVNHIIYQALRERASDIHVEPQERSIRVRYRSDGVLSEAQQPPAQLRASIVSRLKIMAGLDIAERRIPQDGKFQLRIEGRQVDFRVSTLPTVHGEKVVLRILDSSNLALNLESLGFEEKALRDIRSAISSSYGMLLVTGPTGSGKSTTLYSCVNEVLSPTENITTVEDPVEYQIEGVVQVPVNAKRGLTFSRALRSILRQDPDTVMIGEIRDLETAEIAVKAALTGHRVFSTLHTNDAPSTVTRMVDMGIDPFLVASSIQCIAAQRLCRRLCEDCKQDAGELPSERLVALGFTPEEAEGAQLFEPHGCARCQGGYRGRFALLETMPLDEAVRRVVVAGGSALEIRDVAMANGMQTLRRVGILNSLRGKTSLEEVLRVTQGD